jgi:guanine nucleotide-binding protein subunit alpha-12
MKVLVDARDKLNIPWEHPKNYDIGYQLLKFENTMILDARLFLHYVPALQSLWKDASIKKAFDRRREFQLVSFTWFFNTTELAHSYLSSNCLIFLV